MPEIIVHHLESSRSHRILWALEELELPYEIKTYERNPETLRAGDDLVRIHPLGKSPVMTIDGVVYAESGAILEHLSDLADGALRPSPGTEAHRRCRYFLHYAEGSLMLPLFVRLMFDRIKKAPVPFFVKPVVKGIAGKVEDGYTRPELERHLAFLDGEMEGRTWFAGDEFSIADIQMSYPMEAAASRGKLDARYPNLLAQIERAKVRPGYAKAIERGGENELFAH